MSLFNFLNVSPRSELRIRRRKMEGIQLNWKKFELEKAERVERYMDSLSVKAVVSAVLSECVNAICAAEYGRKSRVRKRKDDTVVSLGDEGISNICKTPDQWKRKRKYASCTWHDRSYAIYMLLKKSIFNGNVYTASKFLGIPRTTLCG